MTDSSLEGTALFELDKEYLNREDCSSELSMTEEFEVALVESDEPPVQSPLNVGVLSSKTLSIDGTTAYKTKVKIATVRHNATNLVNFAIVET